MRVERAAFFASFLLFAGAPAYSQTSPSPPPLPSFMPAYEVTRIARSAGFYPLAPPLREGTTYVLRAADFRGILMRVVVDARSGAIRAVNRIVPGPGPTGPIGMLPPSYDTSPPPGGAEFATPEMAPTEDAPLSPGVPPVASTTIHPVMSVFPPLPRPRPAELALRRDIDGSPASERPATTPAHNVEAKPDAAAPPSAPNKALLPLPLND